MTWICLISILLVCIIIYNLSTSYNNYTNSSYFKITKNSYWTVLFNQGTHGEYTIYKNLSELETCGAKFLFNLYLPRENGKTSEIDILLLHPKGLFVIESKNYNGWIFGNERSMKWTQTFPTGDKFYFYNPIMQNATHIRSLRKFIEDTIPVYSVIAFSDDCTLKKVVVGKLAIITQYRNLKYDIINKLDEAQNTILNSAEFNNLYEKLYPYSQVSEDIKINHLENISPNAFKLCKEKENDIKIFPVVIFFIIAIFILFSFNTQNAEKQSLNHKEIIQTYQESYTNSPIISIENDLEVLELPILQTISNEEIVKEEEKLEKKSLRKIKKEEKNKAKSEAKALKKSIKEQQKLKKRIQSDDL